MTMTYTPFSDLAQEVQPPDKGILSRTLFNKEINMQLKTVKIEKPDDTNFILGQTHFIKSVEDIHEALVGAVPGIKFGLAFCEASGKCLVRWSGTDPAMTELAKKNAAAIACRSRRQAGAVASPAGLSSDAA